MIQFEYSLLFLDVPLTVVLTTFDTGKLCLHLKSVIKLQLKKFIWWKINKINK